MTKGKRIGFLDANLENYHANVFLSAIRKDLKNRGFEVSGCLGLEEKACRAWSEKNEIPYFSSPKALNERCDCFMVLAPSNPEVHWDLSQKCLPFGKPTYVDKTFAPDLKTAEAIFALADKHKAAVQTASALRYTNVQALVRQIGKEHVRHITAWGAGGSFGEYAIHPTELVVSCMGPEVRRVMRRGSGKFSQILLDFLDERTATIQVYCQTETPFAAALSTDKETRFITVEGARLFVDTAAAILDFFEAGEAQVDRRESLAIRRILDLAGDARVTGAFLDA